MNKEFHYYVTYLLSKASGFNEHDSKTIAYCSQYVDDNTTSLVIKDRDDDKYINHISQTMNILKPMDNLTRIYTCFHFIPGDYKSAKTHQDEVRSIIEPNYFAAGIDIKKI